MTDDLVTVPRRLLEDLERRVSELEAWRGALQEHPEQDDLHEAFQRFNARARAHEARRVG